MITAHVIAALAPTAAQSMRRWLFHLGGLGLILLGLLDSSLLPIPGSMDVLTIVLAARHGELWLYYAFMATIGSVLGGYVTYRLARKGGKESFERRFPRRVVNNVYKVFERFGFGAIAIPAFLPPPFPMVPFLLSAGAMQYPVRKFLLALTLGRFARYTVLSYLAARYGRHIIAFIAAHGHPVLLAVLGLIAAAVVVFFFVRGSKSKKRTRT
jgi:membrane protein YqaA with SNARE-associated domain